MSTTQTTDRVLMERLDPIVRDICQQSGSLRKLAGHPASECPRPEDFTQQVYGAVYLAYAALGGKRHAPHKFSWKPRRIAALRRVAVQQLNRDLVGPGSSYGDYRRRMRPPMVHPSLDPMTKAGPTSPLAGQVVRESRDIPGEHEESLPLAMIFDVTGSMGAIPMLLQQKPAKLMDVVKEKAGIKDLQVLVGAVGDATTDRYPFQVGQFVPNRLRMAGNRRESSRSDLESRRRTHRQRPGS